MTQEDDPEGHQNSAQEYYGGVVEDLCWPCQHENLTCAHAREGKIDWERTGAIGV